MSTDREIYCRYWPTLMYQSYLICRFLSIAFMRTSEMVQAFTCSKIGKQHQAKRRPVWPNTMILKLVTITFWNNICNSMKNCRDRATFTWQSNFENNDNNNNNKLFSFWQLLVTRQASFHLRCISTVTFRQ